MKKIVYIIIILLGDWVCAQNLVPNSSFEIYSACPENGSEIYFASPWQGITNNSVDYFNTCSISNGIPKHLGGFQYARTGEAMGGFFSINGLGQNYREYLQVELNSSLQMGSCYLVKFYLNLNNDCKYSSNNIGIHFSQNAVLNNGTDDPISVIPQIKKMMNIPIVDTLNWVEIGGMFEAFGNEQYIQIGNFYTNQETTILPTGFGSCQCSFYYIDDVSVIAVSDLPNGMPANPGIDKSFLLGDSVFIGQEISNLNCTWSILGGGVIATNTSGLYVSPTATTTYVVSQNLCGIITTDTVIVKLSGVGLNEKQASAFELYPNPTNGYLQIQTKIPFSNLKIEIQDIHGKKVYQSQENSLSGLFTLDVNLNEGIYFVTFRSQNSSIQETQRIVVLRNED